jgi:hypothetical protein
MSRVTQWKCLWTWRFGHRWMAAEEPGHRFLRCERCGKTKEVGTYGTQTYTKHGGPEY